MKKSPVKRNFNSGSMRTVVLFAVAFILGAVVSGGWYLRLQNNRVLTGVTEATPTIVMSDSTRVILQNLNVPVEVRVYSPANPARLPEVFQGFVSRLDTLLTKYESAAGGKLKVIRGDPQTDAEVRSAAGELGVLPVAGQGGEIFYLGLAVICGKRTEVMPRLAPEWEAALESDLSRAILRVSAPAVSPTAPAAQTMGAPTPIDPAISEELFKMIPAFESLSFEEAAKILRETALDELKSATLEMQTKLQIAQANLSGARENKSESAQAEALKEFQRVKSEQSEKLKQITARLQDRIVVLQRLKSSVPLVSPTE